MRKFFIVPLSAALLLTACTSKSDMSVYDGNYTVDENTAITVNGKSASIQDYENAEISLRMKDGDNCDIILRNMINGQPEVTIPAVIEENSSKSAAGALFYGSGSTTDRTVTVEGVTAETTLASISICEEITVAGIPGRWTVDDARISFSHPDLDSIDLSGVYPGLKLNVDELILQLNASISQSIKNDPSIKSAFMELTSYGHIHFGENGTVDTATEGILTYYIRPDETTLNVFIRKSLMEEVADSIRSNTDILNIFTMFGMTTLIEQPQSISIALQYGIENGGLRLTASHTLLEPYSEMLSQPIETIKAIIGTLSYESAESLLSALGFETIINADNFPAFRDVLLKTFTTITDGQAEYSVTLMMAPYSE